MKRLYFLFAWIWLGSFAFGQDLTIPTFNGEVHSGANTITQSYLFPSDLSIYETINMHVWLTCPPGGCDPWDRYANLKLVHDGEDFEIGRYITPYGNGNCGWYIDVSAYRSMLTDSVTLKSFIETWSNGWEIHVDFEFYLGTPPYLYASVENLWVEGFFRYGDTLFYSIDLPERNKTIPSNAIASYVRIVNTGHGQGNTMNAAEFLPRDHELYVNGFLFPAPLWRNDCGSNPCSPQGGTWTASRAGWCPGADVIPLDWEISGLATPGSTVSIDYVLEPYLNQCSPWYPYCDLASDCMSWVTTCNYDGSGHTDPNYKMSIQLINYSNTPILPVGTAEPQWAEGIDVYPNPSSDKFNISLPNSEQVDLTLTDLTGRTIRIENFSDKLHTLDLEDLSPGVYMLTLASSHGSFSKKLILSK